MNLTKIPGPLSSPEEVKTFFHLRKRGILFSFRSLIFLSILVLIFFNGKSSSIFFDGKILIFLGFFFASLLGMLFIPAKWLADNRVLSALFLLDVLLITLGLLFTGLHDIDLFLVFFTAVFISAVTRDEKSVFALAGVVCVLYGFLRYRATGAFFPTETEFLLRFPFLFVAAGMSGFLALESRKSEEQKEYLRRLNTALSELSDVSLEKLKESHHKLEFLLQYHESVLSSVPSGIIVAEKDRKVRTFSLGASRITGFIPEAVAGKSLEELPKSLAPLAAALARTLEEGKSFVQEYLEIKTERSLPLSLSLETSALRGRDGEILGAIATLKDMTLIRQMGNQLLESERLSALGEMAASVAHEIKNPLNAILGFANRLSEKLEGSRLRRYSQVIAAEVYRMDAIVNDVLEYSRPDRIVKTKADLHGILEEVTTFLDEKLRKGGVDVVRDYDPALKLVPVDVARIRQVLLNLSLNALQAMPQGGRLTLRTRLGEGLAPDPGRLSVEKTVSQQLLFQQKMAAVSVEDTGYGVSPENLPKLFRPFYTTKTTGTGLGLSICHKIVSAHGGRIEAQSEVGKGCRFTFYIPLGEEQPA